MLTENNSGSLKCVFAVGLIFYFLGANLVVSSEQLVRPQESRVG